MEVVHTTEENPLSSKQVATDNQVIALKSLAMLLLREVESLEGSREFSQKSVRNGELTLIEEVRRYETDLIRSALIENHGNQLRAAESLGVKPTTLHAKLRRYGISAYELIANLPKES
jgi:transcriptional regulator with GAF, ATPase, and Fis domain